MATALSTTIRENCGYLQDQGWHQTAELMTLAAREIERLSERVRELEETTGPDERNARLSGHLADRSMLVLGRS